MTNSKPRLAERMGDASPAVPSTGGSKVDVSDGGTRPDVEPRAEINDTRSLAEIEADEVKGREHLANAQLPSSSEIAEDPGAALDVLDDSSAEADPLKIANAQNEALQSLAGDDGDSPLINETTELKDVLTWAMRKLRHPNEQWDFCETHGKVPMTHMCSTHRNEDYARVLRLIGESND